MPIISYFFGIIVRMYHDDHPPMHIHVEYQGFTALISIESGEMINRHMPKKALMLIREWIILHKEELYHNWELAKKFEPLEKIVGADND